MNSLAAIHVAKKQLGLDDDTYRAALVTITGKSSTRDMTEAERNRVVAAFRDRGFKQASSGARKPLEGRYAKKLQGLWIAAWNLGIVRNRDDKALIAFVERQTGLSHVRFLQDAADAMKAIEALKAWLSREAKVDWTVTELTPVWLKFMGARIAVAQWNILVAAEVVQPSMAEFWKLAAEIGKPVNHITDEREWQPIMSRLGERVRQVRK